MKKIAIIFLSYTLLGVLILSGCGGGGGGNSTPNPVTITLKSEPDLDGEIIVWRYDTPPFGYAVSSNGKQISIGHAMSGEISTTSYSYLSFILKDTIPVGAKVQTATLRAYAWQIPSDIFEKLGSVLIDHVNYESSIFNTNYAPTIHNLPPLSTASTQLETGGFEDGWREISVTDMVSNNLTNVRDRSQFRLRFTKDVPDIPENKWLYFYTGDNDTCQPELVITYLP